MDDADRPRLEVADNEDAFERDVAPRVLEIFTACRALGLPLILVFEYAPEKFSSTGVVPAEASVVMHALRDTLRESLRGFEH